MSNLSDLNQYIETMVEKIVEKKLKSSHIVSREAVIVDTYNSVANTATILIPTDVLVSTNYAYKNKTGRTSLAKGDKVYLVYQYGSISQGWLE